ncbi:MAG TPA: phosphoglycerate mutase family protein [Candidatus Saccharimonadales bacterium]|nr:phosphoglycerate mutase family protein [Candidatus Saccharimonadales bacterium]
MPSQVRILHPAPEIIMRYILIRHGKTDANRLTRATFGKQGAPLNDQGIFQAKKLREQLLARGIDLATVTVAVSELLRTTQTAQYAGLKNITAYALLNEVKTPDPRHTQQLIKKNTTARSGKDCQENHYRTAERADMGDTWSSNHSPPTGTRRAGTRCFRP